MEKPKRALSNYNLFYRFKRSKILHACENGDDSKETVNRLITAMPGLEDHPSIDTQKLSSEDVNDIRRNEIRSALCEHLSPKDSSKRSHRKSHGACSFLEMNNMMCSAWKSIDDFARSQFEELANEGRSVYRKRVAEYEASDPYQKSPKKKIKSSGPAQDAALPTSSGDEVVSHMSPTPDVVLTDPKPTKAAAKDKKSAKDADHPKRPLSSYNLFYRFKRSKILDAQENDDYSIETSNKLFTAMPGLEEYPFLVDKIASDDVKQLRRDKIRAALVENLSPKDTSKRSHRKRSLNGGGMSFLEMNKVMCSAWKSIDEYARSVFEELAEEGRGMYNKRVAEYQEKCSLSSPKKKIKTSSAASIVTPLKTQKPKPKIRFVEGPATPTFVYGAPAAAAVVTPMTLTSTDYSSIFDTLDLENDPLPVFPGIFELDESELDTESIDAEFNHGMLDCVSADGRSDSDSSSYSPQSTSSGSEYYDDFPQLPFSGFEEIIEGLDEPKKNCAGRTTSVDDFMKLIATLDESLCN